MTEVPAGNCILREENPKPASIAAIPITQRDYEKVVMGYLDLDE
jgi:hypothetical protein